MRNIGTRFLLPFGLIAILFSWFVFYRAYAASRRHANELVSQQAALALEFNLAIRNYAAKKIRPAVERLSGKDDFDTETMSTSFISRSIFEEVRQQFPEYIIRFASNQPRNPINQANADELRMIEYFRHNPQVSHRTDEIQIDGRRYLAHFTPKYMKAECMRCHGDPKDAPAALVKKYGATASFHRTLGDVAGLDTVAVPVDSVQAGLVSEMHRQSLTLAAGLMFLFGSVMLVFRSVVTRRLAVMATHFHQIAAHPESSSLTQVEVGGKDEIGVVAAAFNRLVEQLRGAQALLEERVVQRTAELAQANEELRREIGERQRAEVALRESEERLRLALAATKQGLYDLNLQTGEAVVSPEYLRMIGYEPEEIAPTADWWREQLHPGDREASFRTLQECVRAERSEYRLEYRLRTKSGGWRWLLSLGKVVKRDAQGQPLRMLGTHTDITDRKQAEEARLELERQLLHAQKLESLGVLAGGVAHDFNNLLAAMLGNLELALLDLSPVSSVRPSLDEAVRVAKRAADLTRQMLAYSGKGQFIVASLNLSELVSENAYMLRAAIAKTVTLNMQLMESPPLIRADAGQVQQVVMNLITNASEAIGDKPGIVVLSTGVQECGQDDLDRSRLEEKAPPGQYVYLEVTDTGCGMDRKTQQRLFDPFFTTKFTGRGLGMSAVLGILRGHHGAIIVESEPGKGTTVRVLFPSTASTAAPAQSAGDRPTPTLSLPSKPLLNGLVIVADDEEAVRKIAQKALTRMGFQCLPAADGEEAVALFRRHRDEVVCVLLDLTMPKKDGLAAFVELRQLKPNMKAILCSGYNEQDVTQRFVGQGLAGFIQKPYNLDRLRSELEKVLKEPL